MKNFAKIISNGTTLVYVLFMISETLKYLYLTFDENNILHSDRNREWVMTTEAHPLHYVPALVDKEKKKNTKDVILRFLKKRMSLSILPTFNDTISITTSLSHLKEEKWTSKLSFDAHSGTIKNILKESRNNGNFFLLFGHILSRVISYPTMNVAALSFSHLIERDLLAPNFALMFHSRTGKGDQISKSCPNHVHTNSLWIQALSSNELNYDDSFVTTFSDDRKNFEKEITMLSNAERTISPLASSVFFSFAFLEGVKNRFKEYHNNTNRDSEKEIMKVKGRSTQRVDMGGDLGMFDLFLHGDGNGFWVRHFTSGEIMEATFFEDDVLDKISGKINAENGLMMVESIFPEIISREKDGKHKKLKMFLDLPSPAHEFVPKRRLDENSQMFINHKSIGSNHVSIVSDLDDGPAFFCEILLNWTINSQGSKGSSSSSYFPCSAATFGPTGLKKLAESNGIEVEAELHAPLESNNFGCKSHAFSNNAQKIQIVHRGACTFQDKAITLSNQGNTSAMIVVNKNNEKLFVMASSGIVNKNGVHDDVVSVLVSKQDGEKLIEHVQRGGSRTQALIRLRVQNPDFSRTKEASRPKWPVVVTTSNKVNLYSSTGWGIQAVRYPSREKQKWQIYILQHNLLEDNDKKNK